MAHVVDILRSVGAESLSPDVFTSGNPVITPVLERIEKSIQDSDIQIYRAINDDRYEFNNQLSTSSTLLQRLEDASVQLSKLQEAYEGEKGVIPQLISQLTSHSDLSLQACRTSSLVSTLTTISNAHDTIAEVKSILQTGDLIQAASKWKYVEIAIGDLKQYDTLRVSKLVLKSYHSLRIELCKQLETLVYSFITINTTKFVIVDRIHLTSDSTEGITFTQACESLSQLCSLDDHFESIYRTIINFIQLVLDHTHHNTSSDPLHVISEPKAEQQQQQIIISTQYQVVKQSSLSTSSTINSFSLVLEAILKIPLPTPLTKKLCQDFFQKLLDLYIQPLLPNDIQGVHDYLSLVDQALELEKTHRGILVEQGESDRYLVISFWNKMFSQNWAQKLIGVQFENVRHMMVDWGSWKSESVSALSTKDVRSLEIPCSSTEATTTSVTSTSLARGSADRQGDEDGGNWDDAWGFEESPPEKEKPEEQNQRDENTVDESWDWNDEDDEMETQKHSRESDTKQQGVQKVDTQQQDFESWEWRDEDEEEDQKNKARQKDTISAALNNQAKSTALSLPKHVNNQEKFTISVQSRALLNIFTHLLEESLRVMNESKTIHRLENASEAIFQAALDVCVLFHAVIPVQYARLLESVPSLGMQFANDCVWLSHECLLNATKIATTSFSPSLQNNEEIRNFSNQQSKLISETSELLIELGLHWRKRQKELQLNSLYEMMNDANGFRNTCDLLSYDQCERCVSQLIASIEQLAHAWKPMLDKETYDSTMGYLIDQVLSRVLKEIENQNDISEEESKKLSELCKRMHEVEKVFKENEESYIGAHVPCWFKFVYLSELLESSMADIMFLFEEGHLIDFEPNEVASLVRALFSDSERRSQNITKILSVPARSSNANPR